MGPRAKRDHAGTDDILSLDKGVSKKKAPSDTGNVFLDSLGKAEGFECDAHKQRRFSAPILTAALQPLGAIGTAGPAPTLDQIK